MQPELEILQSIKAAFLAAFTMTLRIHHGDEIAVAEAKNNLSATVNFDYWLVPDENDKIDELSSSTEGEIQTFSADLIIFGRHPDKVIEELYRVFALIYKTSNLIAGIPDSPQRIGSVWFHRFDPRDDRMAMRAVANQGVWYVVQPLIISASIDV